MQIKRFHIGWRRNWIPRRIILTRNQEEEEEEEEEEDTLDLVIIVKEMIILTLTPVMEKNIQVILPEEKEIILVKDNHLNGINLFSFPIHFLQHFLLHLLILL